MDVRIGVTYTAKEIDVDLGDEADPAQIRSDVQLSAGLTVRFYASRPDGRAKRPPPPRP